MAFERLLPVSDVSGSGWSANIGGSLTGAIDEASPDEADYIVGTGAGATAKVRLAAPAGTPLSTDPHVIRFRARAGSEDAMDLTVRLLKNTTEIARITVSNLSLSWLDYSLTLTSGEIGLIGGDYSALDLEFSQSTGTSTDVSSYAVIDPSQTSTLYQDSGGTTPVTASGQTVGSIKDARSGTLYTTSGSPTYQEQDGLRWLQFDGVDDQINLPANILANRTGLTVATAFRCTASAADGHLLRVTTTGTAWWARTGVDNGVMRVSGRRTFADTVNNNNVSPFDPLNALNEDRVLVAVYDYESANLTVRVDGGQYLNGSFQSAGSTDNTTAGSATLCQPTFAGRLYGAYVGPKLSAADRATVEADLDSVMRKPHGPAAIADANWTVTTGDESGTLYVTLNSANLPDPRDALTRDDKAGEITDADVEINGAPWVRLDPLSRLNLPMSMLILPSRMDTVFTDAAGTTPVTGDGQTVASVRDARSGALYTLSGTAIYRALDDRYWLEFDGTAYINLPLTLVRNKPGITHITAWNCPYTGGTQDIYNIQFPNSANAWVRARVTSDTVNLVGNVNSGGRRLVTNSLSTTTLTGYTATARDRILTARHNFLGNNLTLRLDGIERTNRDWQSGTADAGQPSEDVDSHSGAGSTSLCRNFTGRLYSTAFLPIALTDRQMDAIDNDFIQDIELDLP